MAKNVAEVFPPGEFLKEELEARGWSQIELAEIMGRPSRVVSEVIAAKRAITPETAVALGEALGTGAEFWMNLESQYQLSKVRTEPNVISRRAKLYNLFPVREMIKRGWVEASANLDLLETQFLNYFGTSSIDEKPLFPHAARKTSYEDVSIQQIAWLIRAGKIARAVPVDKFSQAKLSNAMAELRECLEFVDNVRNVPTVLARAGVRLVVVEALPSSKIDGACFWLAKDSRSLLCRSDLIGSTTFGTHCFTSLITSPITKALAHQSLRSTCFLRILSFPISKDEQTKRPQVFRFRRPSWMVSSHVSIHCLPTKRS